MTTTKFACSECGKERDTEALAGACCTYQSPFLPIEPGDFIEIPAWNVTGCVLAVEPADIGSDGALTVLLEERPDDPNPRRYRLEPHEYVVVA